MWKQMRDDDFDQVAIKIVIVGNGVVGKSSLIQRYCNGIFTNEYKKTIGVDFLERFVQVGDQTLRLMLWDTAGQEEFDALTKAYYRGAQGCVVAFSTTDRASFDAVEKWKKKVEFECGDIPMALVQNKSDLIEQRVVGSEDVDRLARRLQMRLFLTSAKNNTNVDEVFYYLAKTYMDSLDEDSTYEEPLTLKAHPESLSYSLLPPPANPLFAGSRNGQAKLKSKYKKGKSNSGPGLLSSGKLGGKKSKQHFQLPAPPTPANGPGMDPYHQYATSNPLLRHFRYAERRFQLIPTIGGGGHRPNHFGPTILLHQPSPWQPYYSQAAAYSQQQHRQHHHKRRSRTCWIL